MATEIMALVVYNAAWAETYLCTKWHLDPSSRLATTDMGWKVWVLCPFWGRAGSPSNTIWPWLRPTSVPSFILINLTVWPQYTNATDRTDRQDKTDNRNWVCNGYSLFC